MSYASLLLVARPGRAEASALAADMANWLDERGVKACVIAHCAEQHPDGAALRAAAQQADAVVVLGGDGTFIGVARQLIGLHLPFLGINCGRLGFLSETPASAWREALHDMLAGTLRSAPRTVLAWRLERDGAEIATGHAINDVFIGRGGLARVINLHLSVCRNASAQTPAQTFAQTPVPAQAPAFGSAASVWGELGWVRADGMIVASPLGSSAYSLSARGPLLYPDMSNLLVTAVAPFMGGLPPLVLPGESCVRIRPEAGVEPGDICLTVDGQEGMPLQRTDTVYVCGVADGLHVLLRQPDSYFQTLRGREIIRVAQSPAALPDPGGSSGAFS